MWKVGGSKIERTRARYIFLMSGHVNSRKSDFWGKTLPNRKFSTVKFFEATTHRILMHSGFRKCSRFGWPSLRFEVTAAQSEVIGQKPEVLQKIRGVLVLEPMFYSFQSNWTKIGEWLWSVTPKLHCEKSRSIPYPPVPTPSPLRNQISAKKSLGGSP